MSINLKKNIYLLSLISKIKNKKARQGVLKDVVENNAVLDALNEICLNLLNGNIKIEKTAHKSLGCKDAIRCMAHQHPALKKKKNRRVVVSQLGGGFWMYLISIVAEMIASAIKRM